MGIKGFLELIKCYGINNALITIDKENQDAFKERYQGKTFVMEVSNLMYKFVYVSGELFIGHFLKQYKYLTDLGINVTYVFDGKPLKEKDSTLKNRHEQKRKQELKWEKDLDFQKNRYPIPEYYDQLKKSFDEHKIKYFQAVADGEAGCVQFQKVYGDDNMIVVSDDWDVLAYGATKVIRHLTGSQHPCVEVNTSILLSNLEMNYDSFLDVCILCGTDFNILTIPGIGVKRAVQKIKKYKNIETYIESKEFDNIDFQKKCNMTKEEFIAKFIPEIIKTRQIFKEPNQLIEKLFL